MKVILAVMWNQLNDQLPVGLLAQLVKHCRYSLRSWVQIPYRPVFFSGLIFTTAQVVHIPARITFIHVLIRS